MANVTVGPWKAVVDADDPDSAAKDLLYDAVNVYPPDTGRASAYVARPGVASVNSGAALADKVRAIHRHVRPDGVSAQYAVSDGKLYKIANTLTSYSVTNVTPTTVSINPASSFVFLESFADKVIVNDQFHPPWAFNPEDNTGAYIRYDAAGATLLSIGAPDYAVHIAATKVPLGDLTRLGYSASDITIPPGTVPLNTWAGYRVTQGILSGTATAAAANYTTGYATEAAAIAAIPAPTNTEWDIGYFTVKAQAGSAWIAGTHSLAGGGTSPALTTNYYAQQAASWMAKGKPTVYGAKLFFILYRDNTDLFGNAITWSEEADSSVGYHQSGYDNVWELTQTTEDGFNAIHGCESGLYCGRARSILRITGVVDTVFQSNATTDDILTVGVAKNGTFAQVEQDLWFPDAEWRPRCLPIGGTVVDIFEDMRRTSDAEYATAVTNGVINSGRRPIVVYWPTTKLVLYRLWDGVTCYAFDSRSRRYVGRMVFGISTGVFLDALGVLYDSDGTPLLYVSGALASGSSAAAGGYFWREKKTTESSRWLDATSTVPTLSVTARFPTETDDEFLFDPVSVLSMSAAPMTIQNTTQRSVGSTTSAATPQTSTNGSYRADWGLERVIGRGLRTTVVATTASAQWGVSRVKVGAKPQGSRPGSY